MICFIENGANNSPAHLELFGKSKISGAKESPMLKKEGIGKMCLIIIRKIQ
jgi:hypothetical protein